MNFSELNLDITLAAFAEASDDDLKAWAEDVAPQGDLGVDYDTLDSYESESDLEDCYDYGGGCGSIMITFADGHWVDYTVDFHFSRMSEEGGDAYITGVEYNDSDFCVDDFGDELEVGLNRAFDKFEAYMNGKG